MSDRYVIVNELELITGVVNWDGHSAHPYGLVDLRGPISPDKTLEQLVGKPCELPRQTLIQKQSEKTLKQQIEELDSIEIKQVLLEKTYQTDHLSEPPSLQEEPPVSQKEPDEKTRIDQVLLSLTERKPAIPWVVFRANALRILGTIHHKANRQEVIELLKARRDNQPSKPGDDNG